MRNIPTLLELEEIPILLQYLYMDEENCITVDNGMTEIKIRMTENCDFRANNLSFSDLPAMNYTEMMTISNMLGIIEQLKNVPPVEIKSFSSRWEEIRSITLATVAQNKMNWRE